MKTIFNIKIILIPFFHGKNIFYIKRKQLEWNLMRKIFQIGYQLNKMLDLKNFILKAFSPFVFYHIRLIDKI